MLKRYNTHTLAFIIGLFSFLLVFLTSYLVFSKVLYSAIVAIVLFVFVYGIVYYYISQILDKKINTIYKFINQTKAGKKELFYKNNILPRPTLDVLTEDVKDWAIKNEADFALLEKNEKYRKEFLQNLSHELKTPLFAMQGYLETLLEGGLHDSAIQEKYISNCYNNLQRLTALVNDLSIITKLESQTESIKKVLFNIAEIVDQALHDFQRLAKEKNIQLLVKPNSLRNIKVNADALRIKQVLDNLIENAIKYSKPNGVININIELLNEKTVIVEIADNGYGIAPEHLDRIFERFYRTDLARSRNIGGSGLGLAICKHIMEAHEQTIHVRSNINVGTTFRFTLEKG